MIPLIIIFFLVIHFYEDSSFNELFSQTQDEESSYNTTLPEHQYSENKPPPFPNNNSYTNTENISNEPVIGNSSESITSSSNVGSLPEQVEIQDKSYTIEDYQQKEQKKYSPAIIEAQNMGIIDDSTELYCKTTKGKQILLRVDNFNATYVFGKNLQQPEITVVKPLNEINVEYGDYSGGSTIIVTLHNGGSYKYVLEFGKIKDTQGISFNQDIGTVSAFNKGKRLVKVECDDPNAIYQKDESIFYQ